MAYLNPRYSMTTLMRLSQYYYVKSAAKGSILHRFYGLFASYLRRKNITWNDFEHGVNPRIAPGIVLHHTGVCITSKTIIETEVHLYRNVTFGEKNGGAPPYQKRRQDCQPFSCVGSCCGRSESHSRVRRGSYK